MTPGDTVQMRTGGERLGRVVSPSVVEGYDWLVAWQETNIRTHERARDLRLVRDEIALRRCRLPDDAMARDAGGGGSDRRPPARATTATTVRTRKPAGKAASA